MPEKSKRTKPKGDPKAGGANPGGANPGGGGNAWVDDGLRKLYDDVAAEPLPQDLLDLLNEIDPDKLSGGGKP
ncbi:NepR family anti-sigma factor [Zavarzinia compransoris]|uniref:Anti-sigma factor NepR domain-containing protein n=1 Tax=Zavarzinia compransoris TaxID=1264899 RepID=A0A317E9Y2_9PROT|nr:NepR family anti-sigma factor [Zavarzinia compransoris]PWR21945.1 hypothetical protein DKG75_08175 [Zavarzinia compransoris]TDP47317.1 hypothetical protein DES42_103489 [Zavarzinia compransoris]